MLEGVFPAPAGINRAVHPRGVRGVCVPRVSGDKPLCKNLMTVSNGIPVQMSPVKVTVELLADNLRHSLLGPAFFTVPQLLTEYTGSTVFAGKSLTVDGCLTAVRPGSSLQCLDKSA
ncbi:Uncharacterised protein [Salmonella enterica]|uniref:Uncharacterized protein n=3 Tax=Salmonella enterica TaxID=28901 RepID=A0A7D8ET38_SALER|nr:Uncharacterised protein [Salmonella enterica]